MRGSHNRRLTMTMTIGWLIFEGTVRCMNAVHLLVAVGWRLAEDRPTQPTHTRPSRFTVGDVGALTVAREPETVTGGEVLACAPGSFLSTSRCAHRWPCPDRM